MFFNCLIITFYNAFIWLLLIGWEPGTQYEYRYVGRSVAGMYNLKLQNAVIELHSLVIVQSVEENTIIVKVRLILSCLHSL